MSENVMVVGESFVGGGAEVAHINTVLGRPDRPVGVARVTAPAAPWPGHTPFVTVLQQNLPVKPLTLFVNNAPIADDLLLIAAIWVNPAAKNADLVYRNNRAASRAALGNANPFFKPA